MVLVTCNRKGLQPLLVVCFFFVFFCSVPPKSLL